MRKVDTVRRELTKTTPAHDSERYAMCKADTVRRTLLKLHLHIAKTK